jgi:citrate synthase
MMEEPTNRIARPRQVYTGAAQRPYVDIGKR